MIDEVYPEFRHLSGTNFGGPYPESLTKRELGWQQ
jgi:hypothetical protein